MDTKILLKANVKRHKGSLAGIFLLILLAAAALGTVLSVWTGSNRYIRSEIRRAGFGTVTAWTAGVKPEALAGEMEALPEIDHVDIQHLIYSNYMIHGQESDSEGQLITYVPQENRYRFLTEDLSGYLAQPERIEKGSVYVPPSLSSMFGVKIGDQVTFPIARAGTEMTLTVRGFYEDPFMGSSMIGMKGFLIGKEDREEALSVIEESGIDALARDGAMLHIYEKEGAVQSVSELNHLLNQKTSLAEYTEDVHGEEAMAGFMLILQNAFSGLMAAFVAVLFSVVLIVISHSISSTIAFDYVNMGILKTMGLTAGKLQRVQLWQYLLAVVPGLVGGFLSARPLGDLVRDVTLTTTGVRIPVSLPLLPAMALFLVLMSLLAAFLLLRTRVICRITPMEAIKGETYTTGRTYVRMLNRNKQKAIIRHFAAPEAVGKGLQLRLALRQLISGRKRYVGTMMTALLLVFFASLAGRMQAWLGADGQGMMDAFNPADHDLGVQSFGELTQEEFEKTIRAFTGITDTYVLAMPSLAVNGVDYTANVIDQPQRFHLLEGKTCISAQEIVLTEFVAADFGVSIGDTVTVRGDLGSEDYVVSGIYSCANDMGDNVGMSREGYLRIGSDPPNLWCWHYFLTDPAQKTAIAGALEELYGGDIHVHENTWPGLSGIISAMHILLAVMYGFAAVFILVVTILTGSKILAAEQKDLGVYRALGFRAGHLRLTFALRFGMAALPGTLLGTALAAVMTDPLVSAVMKLAGISNFASAPGAASICIPGFVVEILFLAFAYLEAGKVKKVDMTVLVAQQ